MSTEETSTVPTTCGAFFSRLTVASNRDQDELSRLNRVSSRKFNDGFMVADLTSMTPKFGWWNVVDGAMLQHYSCSKPQSATERWFRLEKKAAKVGKGLVKNGKGRKLVSQHWLEAVDPLHRYGHNLRFYFEAWCQSETKQPFFFWLDFGEGKDLDLQECTKSVLQKERIRYLGPTEREQYEVIVEGGKLLYKQTREPVNSTKGDKWIFVVSTSGVLYIGKKERGNLQHSSFLAGAAITSAGRLRVKDGIIKHIEAHSGHYHPTPENFKQLISILESRGVDLTTAKIQYSSKDMLKRSKSLKFLQMGEDRGKLVRDTSPTPSPSLSSQGSLTSEGSVEDANGHCAADECNGKEEIMRNVRDLRLSGEHDIFKRENCNSKEDDVDHSSRSLETNLLAENGWEPSSGLHSEDEQQSVVRKSVRRDCAVHCDSHATVERVQPERVKSDLDENCLNHVQGDRIETLCISKEPLSLRNEKVMEEKSEDVVFNQTYRGH